MFILCFSRPNLVFRTILSNGGNWSMFEVLPNHVTSVFIWSYATQRNDEKKNCEKRYRMYSYHIIAIRHISCKSGPTVTSYTVRKRVCEKLDNGLFFLLYYVFVVTRRKLMRPLLNNLLGIKPKAFAALLDHGIDIVIYCQFTICLL